MPSLTVAELFIERESRLGLSWAAPRLGGERLLASEQLADIDRGTVGHVTLLRPLLIPVVGRLELAHWATLNAAAQTAVGEQLVADTAAIVVMAEGCVAPGWIQATARAAGVALWSTAESAPRVVASLGPYLQRRLGPVAMVHGVFLDVLGVGVLILGDSSIGKSELGLELISRGAGLVADDAVELQQIGPDSLQGQCPTLLRDSLEVRGLGVLNVKTVFGETQVRPRKTLSLIVQLRAPHDPEVPVAPRLAPTSGSMTILGVEIPQVTLTVKAGRNLAVLVEVAVRNWVLQHRGIDTTRDFIDRQRAATRAVAAEIASHE
jgi:HPr kinase/phosphorylase